MTRASTVGLGAPSEEYDSDSGSDSSASDDGEGSEGGPGADGIRGASAAWRASMAAGAAAGAAEGKSSSGDADGQGMPDTPRPKMICDALAVLVVATFKINVRCCLCWRWHVQRS